MTDPVSDPARPRDRGPVAAITATLNAFGTVWIVALMLLIVADIALRNLMNAPINGVPEMVSFSIVGIVFLQLSHALRVGSLTRSELLLNMLRPQGWPRRVLLALFNLTGAVILAIALWRFYPSFQSAWSNPARHFMGSPGVFVLPRWPLYGLMLIGLAATVLQFAALTLAALKGGDA
ncbi:MAG: TRAP transporter small permease [Rhodobacteraceae bacterium]|nr:TRAP transporter small permease [Paracoccaceae bacterium]